MDQSSKDLIEAQKILAEIKLITADTDKRHQDYRLAPWTMIFTAMGAGAAFFAAGATLLAVLIKWQ